MNAQNKRRIVFALLMGIATTGIISFFLIAINVGLSEMFVMIWLRSWAISYVIVTPVILLIGPRLQALVDRLII